jgi:hypothetical protein
LWWTVLCGIFYLYLPISVYRDLFIKKQKELMDSKNFGPHVLWLALVIFITINFSSLSAQIDEYSTEKLELFAEVYLEQKLASQRLAVNMQETSEITKVITEEKYKKVLEESLAGKALSLTLEEREYLGQWINAQNRIIRKQLREDLRLSLANTELSIDDYDEMYSKLEKDIHFADKMKPHFQKIIDTNYKDE